jgi:hypothetical protein
MVDRGAPGRPGGGITDATRPGIDNRPGTRPGVDRGINRDVNRDINRDVNRDINRNWDANRNWDGDWDFDGWGGCCYGGWGVAAAATAAAWTTAAVIGSTVWSIPDSCTAVIIDGVTYQQCGSDWYQPYFAGSDMAYVVVEAPDD